MFTDKANGTRLFARLRSFDFECPRCGRLYSVHPKIRYLWYNPRTAIFKCLDCNLALAFGLLMYPVAPGGLPNVRIPEDTVPDPRQSAALRQLQTAIHLDKTQARPHGTRPVNKMLRRPCNCQVLRGGAKITHPGCPVHGAAAQAGDQTTRAAEETTSNLPRKV
jgi:hypothetical protein